MHSLDHSQWGPVQWDQRVARAAQRWSRWKRRYRVAAGADDDPLYSYRDVSGLRAFEAASELPDADPLRVPLRRWVYRLAEQRINHGGLTTLNQQRQILREIRDTPHRKPMALAEIFHHALSDAPQREIWLDLYLSHSRDLSSNMGMLWERRAELARRMGLDTPSSLEGCSDNGTALAQQTNAALRDRLEQWELSSPARFIESALGSDCNADWPAHLTRRNLLEFFRQTDLFRCLPLDNPSLPTALGAASFQRALGQLGSSWSVALAPTDQPYVIAHDPYGLQRHTAACLFATLPLNPTFLQHRLNVSSRSIPDARRRLARVWLLDLAARAFRVQMRQFALAGRTPRAEAYRALAHSELHLDLPSESAGAFFRLRIEDEQRFAGALRAYNWQQRLIEEHDEDWYRNPRAIEQMRAEARRPPPTKAGPEELKKGLDGCLAALDSML